MLTGTAPPPQEEKKDADISPASSQSEREVWEFMTPMAWHKSITEKGSIFRETYEATRRQMEDTIRQGGFDCVLEVGCGTGDVIGLLDLPSSVARFGLDINEEFLEFCRESHNGNSNSKLLEFSSVDALYLVDWWKSRGLDQQYHKPMVVCVNNTLNIMPNELRGAVVDQMLQLAGKEGTCMVSYWNGTFFSHAVMNYYAKNPNLCGTFSMDEHVDWQNRHLLTPTNYSTEWHYPHEVQQLLRAYDIDVPNLEDAPRDDGAPHVNCRGLSIFVWFNQTSTSRAKTYYDSEDAQSFYHHLWGQDNLHVGRYDLLTQQDKEKTMLEQVQKAQDLHEQDLLLHIRHKLNLQDKEQAALLRVVDFGCGYGGLLRRLVREGLVWSAVGCDISTKMCAQARRLNEQHLPLSTDIQILEESYLDTSLPKESADLVLSMDALLHVGPERQKRAIQEAARVLRPGGWILFSDIMECPHVDAQQMQPIYQRIHLSKMGTVQNYQQALEDAGFTSITVNLASENISQHYASILTCLEQKGDEIGLSQDYQTSAKKGLETWKRLAPNNIEWGIIAAQKTRKVHFHQNK